MTVEEVINFFGSRSKTAEKCGVTRQAVYRWEKENCVPYYRQLLIHELTNGALKANADNLFRMPKKRG